MTGQSGYSFSLKPYLAASPVIDFNNPDVARKASELAAGCMTPAEIAGRCFLFVRDEILHSLDHHRNPVTLAASDVLRYGTGFCYAKSHLLAALLRANGIPTGLCYQRLVTGGSGQEYSLHGLNAVWLDGIGWYRCDARGLMPGHPAEFAPPAGILPYTPRSPSEADLPEIWPEPLPVIVEVLTRYTDIEQVHRNWPDVEIF